mmetsp:Transcript_19663/g.34924  ORF Transcript_19663/g.34924 Transcript_19663/m.34924 type:complete len:97 (-) Transcript_19663:2115-2405(-)
MLERFCQCNFLAWWCLALLWVHTVDVDGSGFGICWNPLLLLLPRPRALPEQLHNLLGSRKKSDFKALIHLYPPTLTKAVHHSQGLHGQQLNLGSER